MSFESLGLAPEICRALADAEYVTPTPIQLQAIPELLAGSDIVASADTGTGKTAAFMLPALQMLSKPSTAQGKGPRVLILTPTRELATQVSQSARDYGKYLRKVRTVSILGGMPYDAQRRDLRNFVDIVVATPGRLLDHYRADTINFDRVELLVLDEADRMLDMGFSEDVHIIAEAIAKERQTVLFSATLGKKILSLASTLTVNPKRLEIESIHEKNENISQSVVFVQGHSQKNQKLLELLGDETINQAIIFSATKRGTEDLADMLNDKGLDAIALNGDMRQRNRDQTIKKMRAGNMQFLIATDVAARGIDIPTITHVINYDVPRTAEDYTHRIGRTGRAGAKGSAITLVTPSERYRMRQMERLLTGLTMPAAPADSEKRDGGRPDRKRQDSRGSSRGGPRRSSGRPNNSARPGNGGESKGRARPATNAGESQYRGKAGGQSESNNRGKPNHSERTNGAANQSSGGNPRRDRGRGRNATVRHSPRP